MYNKTEFWSMKCAICRKREATQTRHVSYAPEITIEVCLVCHGLLHRKTRIPQEKSEGIIALYRYLEPRLGHYLVREEVVAVVGGLDDSQDVNYYINYFIRQGHLVRILRELYYVRTWREKTLKILEKPLLEVIGEALNHIGAKWYYGLYTALRLNAMTHEYFDALFVLSDSIYRPRPIHIQGEKAWFIKIKPWLTSFGIVRKRDVAFSDPEKTILDVLYLSRYGRISERTVRGMLTEYSEELDWGKVSRYLRYYPRSLMRIMEETAFPP